MRVKLSSARVFDVQGSAGRLEGMRQVGEEWNGMIELRSDEGARLILRRNTGPREAAVSELLSGITGDGGGSWRTVVSGAPGLIGTLGLPEPEASTPAPAEAASPWTTWQPMSTAPEDVAVLVLTEGSDIPLAARWRKDAWYTSWEGNRIERLRCWMYCPAPTRLRPQDMKEGRDE